MKRDKILKIYHDDSPESPRDWDNVGTMACWHNRYNLGDEQPDVDPLEYMKYLVCQVDDDFEDEYFEAEEAFFADKDWSRELSDEWDEAAQIMIEEAFDKYYISLPLYLYDHSGITMSTGPFSCPWDSGQVGFIYVSRENAAKEWADTTEKQARNYLCGEVEVYDQYLRGEVYGFVIEDLCGEEFDSCWGFFGDDWRTNGIADHINESEIAKVQMMMPATYQTHEVFEEEDLCEDQVA